MDSMRPKEFKPHQSNMGCNGSVAIEIEVPNEDTKVIVNKLEDEIETNGCVVQPIKSEEIYLSRISYSAPNSEHLLVRSKCTCGSC